jgi:ATP-binding cassette subfamily B protein
VSGPRFGRGPLTADEELGGPSRPVGAALPLLRRAARFFLPYQGRLALIATLIAASSVIGLANPYLLKLMIDDAFPKGDIGLLGLYAALMVIVPIINGGIGLAQSWMTASVGQYVMRDLRNLLFTHVQSMPIRFFSETRTGEIQSRLTNDVSGVQSVVSDAAANLA